MESNVQDEKRLISEAQNGSRLAFKSLMESNMSSVYYLAMDLIGNNEEAYDLCQEVFVKAWRGLDGFRGDSKFSSWLHRITVNSALSLRRQKKYMMRKEQQTLEKIMNLSGEDARANDAAMAWDVNRHIQASLQTLSEKERAAFVMRHLHDKSLSDISETMKITVGTVKSLLFRGMQKMRRKLKGLENEFK